MMELMIEVGERTATSAVKATRKVSTTMSSPRPSDDGLSRDNLASRAPSLESFATPSRPANPPFGSPGGGLGGGGDGGGGGGGEGEGEGGGGGGAGGG